MKKPTKKQQTTVSTSSEFNENKQKLKDDNSEK